MKSIKGPKCLQVGITAVGRSFHEDPGFKNIFRLVIRI